MIAAGLPVPEGFVIDGRAFRFVVGDIAIGEPDTLGPALELAAARIGIEEAPPATLVEEVNARAAKLGTVAVRSSASIEDGASGSAAGVFASVTNVPARDVWSAIRAVWTSALTPLAAAYARGRAIDISVIVQRMIPGDRITIYTRPPGAPTGKRITIQRGEYVRDFARDDIDPLVALALRAEHAIGATNGADVELVETRDGTPWIVQARPIVHPPAPSLAPPPPALLAALVADGRRWTWDIAHNPDPMSPAQAGLVERVEQARVAPWSMRLCAGYLYTTPLDEPSTQIDNFEARAAAIEARFAQILDIAEPSLAEAIDRYVSFYAVWAGELAPLIASARRALAPANLVGARPSSVEPTPLVGARPSSVLLVGARPSSVEATLLAAARGDIDEATAIDRLAPLSTTWDVAVPTFGERPAVIRDAIARARNVASSIGVGPDDARVGPELLHARAVADLAERDDVWFAKAQTMVRFALLRRGRELEVDVEDIFWISLEDALVGISADDAHRRASAAKAANQRAAKWAMPLVINGETDEEAADRPALRGFGSGSRVSGRVVRFASLASAVAVGRGDVIVTRAITPALAVFVIGCAAIVSETGGPLDHGAAIARELGIPFVVGCRDAWSLLRDGTIVTIDHDTVTTS